MLPGGTILLFNTEDVKEHIMKWAAVCALVQDCIAPPGSNVIARATVFGRHHKRSMAVVIDMIKLSWAFWLQIFIIMLVKGWA